MRSIDCVYTNISLCLCVNDFHDSTFNHTWRNKQIYNFFYRDTNAGYGSFLFEMWIFSIFCTQSKSNKWVFVFCRAFRTPSIHMSFNVLKYNFVYKFLFRLLVFLRLVKFSEYHFFSHSLPFIGIDTMKKKCLLRWRMLSLTAASSRTAPPYHVWKS